MTKSRIHELEARLDVLSCVLRALLAASTPEVLEHVARGLQDGIDSTADNEAVDAVRAGALWQLLRGNPLALQQTSASQ